MCLGSGKRHICQYSQGGDDFKNISSVSRRTVGAQQTCHAYRPTYQTKKTYLRDGRVRGAD